MAETLSPSDVLQIERPDARLLKYYLLFSLCSGPFFPVVFIPLWFRFSTLKYKFDDEGISMSWGVLFRQEVNLTYRRIQDIHMTRNLLQRWMGLATISLQTASGNSGAEMSIEGILAAEGLRDYLYSRMRGSRNQPLAGSESPTPQKVPVTATVDEVTQTLSEIRDALQRLVAKRGAS